MTVQALGYVGVRAQSLADWASYGTGFLGLQLAERGAHQLRFRMDDRKQRLVVAPDSSDGPAFFGWEVADAAALDALAGRLEAAGTAVHWGDRALADQRHVAGLAWCLDPAGNRLEFVHGAEVADEPFQPSRAISGFRTGAQGMGHAVLTVPSMDQALPFYRDVLGFRISDYVLNPFKAYFLHVNARHHSLALIEGPKAALHHIMIELFSLDDVGQGYDLALAEEGRIATTLGRHTNDFMTSFYARTPGGFMLEYGWGGRAVDPDNWQSFEMTSGPSLWGHERSWGSDAMRAEAKRLKLAAAARGERQPVQVLPGNHALSVGECPWWDATTRGAQA